MKNQSLISYGLLLLSIIFSHTLTAQDIQVRSCKVVSTGNIKLVASNLNVINNGTIDITTGDMIITGASPTRFDGNGSTRFNNLVIKKTAGQVLELQQPIAVTGNVVLQSGYIQLHNHLLDLREAGMLIGENDQTYITADGNGGINVVRSTVGGLQNFNPGNIGLELRTDIPVGKLRVLRQHITTPLSTDVSIKRVFLIEATQTLNVNARVKIFYLTHELNGVDENTLSVWAKPNATGFYTWEGSNERNTAANYLAQVGIRDLHGITAGGNAIALTKGQADHPAIMQHMTTPTTTINTAVVYPNPIDGQCTLVIPSGKKQEEVISLYNTSGKLLQQKKVQLQTGNNLIVWNMQSYAAGLYLLTNKNGSVQLKLVKK